MAFRVKRSFQGSGSLALSPEIDENNGDFMVDTDGRRILCECARVTRAPLAEKGIRVTQDLFDYIAEKIRPYARFCCVKIRVRTELKRADFNMILQLLKRTLERHERTGELSATFSQQGIEVSVEPLTEHSEKIPFQGVHDSEWVNTVSIGGVMGKSSQEVSEMFRAGIGYEYGERGRVFIKYLPPAKAEDPYARLVGKIHNKVSQTKIPSGTGTAKFLWIDSPYDLRTLDSELLRQQPIREMSRSTHTLGVIVTHREGNPHFRHYYPLLGCLNQSGLPGFPDFARTLEALKEKEVTTDALQQERLRRGMTWQQVADELPGFTPSMLTNLATGPLIGFPRVMIITQWLNRPAASFVRARSR